jgi:hypothetical protein
MRSAVGIPRLQAREDVKRSSGRSGKFAVKILASDDYELLFTGNPSCGAQYMINLQLLHSASLLPLPGEAQHLAWIASVSRHSRHVRALPQKGHRHLPIAQ